MFFPISDDDQEVNSPAIVSNALLVANVLVFLVQMSQPEFTYGWSVIPERLRRVSI